MATTIVKNNSGVAKNWGGNDYAIAANYTIEEVDRLRLLSDATFLTDLASTAAIINNGSVDLSAARGLLYLRGLASEFSFNNATNGFVATNIQAAIEEARAFISTPVSDQSYYVSKQGNDTTGNGSLGNPYLTIGKALTVIVDASPTKRYTIFVGPGDYNEALSWKANVFTKGAGPIATRITGATQNINEATWNVLAADNRSGWQDLSLNGVCTWDFTAQTNNSEGKLYVYNIRTSGAWTLTAQNAINQIIVRDTDFFGAWTQNGMSSFMSNSTFQSGAITVNSAAAVGVPAILTMVGGRIAANITATWTSNAAVTLNLAGVNVGAATVLTASGASCTVNANDGSLPVPANRSFVSSAILNRINDNFAGGLLSLTTNVNVAASAAPTVGMALVANSSTDAAWQYIASSVALSDFGDGSDGNVTVNTAIQLTRTMYYNDLTISAGGTIDANGYKIYVKGTLTNNQTAGIKRVPNNGTNGSGQTNGNGGAALTENDVGPGLAGQAGANGGGSNSTGVPGNNAGTAEGYGSAGGASGSAGSTGTAGAAGTYTHVPERVIRHDHVYKLDYKNGGQGGAGGAGGAASLLAAGGGGGGGGSGGGVLIIFARTINNTGSFTCLGGNGATGGAAPSGNSRGGGGGGGGGGGQIYVICLIATAIGTLNVAGGTAGAGGAGNGSGAAGAAGSAGSTGHTSVYTGSTNTWTVT